VVFIQEKDFSVDYFLGKPIKAYIGADVLWPTAYDKYSSSPPGHAAQVINQLRSESWRRRAQKDGSTSGRKYVPQVEKTVDPPLRHHESSSSRVKRNAVDILLSGNPVGAAQTLHEYFVATMSPGHISILLTQFATENPELVTVDFIEGFA
jgi:hypothetical protein